MHFTPELLGYLASSLVVVSLTLRSIVRLRLLSLAGAVCFLSYGVMIGARPVVLMNSFIIAINLYHLTKLLRVKSSYSTIEVRPDEAGLRAFLDYYRDDIRRFAPPEFGISVPPASRVFQILRAAAPVGVVIAEPVDAHTLFIRLDYVTPDYRDLRPGRHFFEQYAPRLAAEGITRLTALRGSDAHADYLRAMGFGPSADPHEAEPRYVRPIEPPRAPHA